MRTECFKLIFFLNILFDSIVLISGKYISTLKNENIDNNKNLNLRNLEESNTYDSYMVIYFKEDYNYKEFYNIYRRNISFIINRENNDILMNKTEFSGHKEFGIEIHFDTSIKNLESFFSRDIDKNMQYLVSIDLTKFDSSSVTIMDRMFYACNSLESIILSNSDISNVESMDLMFYGCSSLKSINLSNLKASKLTIMNGIFSECNSLKFVNFSNFDCPLLFQMSDMFFGCTSLESVDFTNFHSPLLFDTYNMFYGCTSLKSINLSNFDTSQVSIMNNMFYGCSSLRVIDLSNFDMKECTSYDDIFSNIDNIRYINLYNFKNDKIISQIFKYAKNLFFVCQKDNIITNPNAYNCCDYNYETDKCDSYKINDIDIIDNTIIQESTDNATPVGGLHGKGPKIDESKIYIIYIIVSAIIVIATIITLILIYIKYKNNNIKKPVAKSDKNNNNNTNPDVTTKQVLTENNKINTYIYEPEIEDINKILVHIVTTKQLKVDIYINPYKKMCELINYYFEIIGQKDLLNDESIRFILNANIIQHDSTKLIIDYKTKFIEDYNILVDDVDEKITMK